MYLLGVISALLTLPNITGAKLYSNLWAELFMDVYIMAAILTVLPFRLRRWVRALLYIVYYAVAIIDVYCFWKFNSTLTPSMLMLVNETDPREASDFLSSFLSFDLLFSPLSWIFGLITIHLLWAIRHSLMKGLQRHFPVKSLPNTIHNRLKPLTPLFNSRGSVIAASVITLVTLGISICSSIENKSLIYDLYTAKNVGEVEHKLTKNPKAENYLPIYRLAFSMFNNHLAEKQLAICYKVTEKAKVDSCSFSSPKIVLIIGESYGKVHSAQYGYDKNTTPRQKRMARKGLLTPFTDVVSCWNLTSYVFKNILSTHVIGQSGEWCDYPLFPVLFKKAGYKVTFLTNQFLTRKGEAVYDFSGGFFLNDPQLNSALFDRRNTTLHRFDRGLLDDYDNMAEADKKQQDKTPQLIIFHLMGQHVSYRTRYPKDRKRFNASDYDESRPDLNHKQKEMLADYDNAILYNDSIVDAICKRFRKQEAIVIYMPDHGEECYEPGRGFFCRHHNDKVDWPLAHYEFEIPFWIYCSRLYAARHPEVVKAIRRARHKRFMTDALPHLLMGIAGIHTKYYNEKWDLLSPQYDENRPRILKNTADYDLLRQQYQDSIKAKRKTKKKEHKHE